MNYILSDGVLFDINKTELIMYPPNKTDATYTVPATVKSISDYAFKGCTSLTAVTIPKGVTSIGYCAFRGCTALTEMTIPEGITSIDDGVFDGCSALTSITIPGTVTEIGSEAFDGCSALTSITIPGTVTEIGSGAFYGCSALTEMTIPQAVTEIGGNAFEECTSLASINVDSGNLNYSSAGGVLFNKSMTKIIKYPAKKSGNAYSIPSGVTRIADSAFDYCTGLTSITIPGTVTRIGDNAFEGCAALTAMTIPGAVAEIGDYAFWNCTGLASINVDSENQDYSSADGVLFNKNMTKIIKCPAKKNGTAYSIPSGVTRIDDSAFDHCIGLTSITIPGTVATIYYNAFYNCSGLTSITLPASVTELYGYDFTGCSSLKEVYSLSAAPPSIFDEEDLFDESVYADATLYVPQGSPDAYAKADGWKYFRNIKEFDPTHIGAVADSGLKVSVHGNTVTVTGAPEKARISVYDAAGQIVYSGTETTVTVNGKGIYIVNAAGKSAKVKM